MKEAKNVKNSFQKMEYKYLPEIIYGGIDGAVTTFAVVAGAIGASLSATIILILGFANLVGDGFSMSISNYLSTKSEKELHPRYKYSLGKIPLKTAWATFLAFFIVGFIPLFSFVLSAIFKSNYLTSNQFIYSFFLTGFALVIVGVLKGKITGKDQTKSAIETLLIGGVAAGLAFAVGYLMKTIVG